MLIKKRIFICIASLFITTIVSAAKEVEPTLQLTGMLGIANIQQNDATYDLTSSETDKLVATDTQNWDSWSLQLGAGYKIPLFWNINKEKSADDIQWFTAITPQINFYILNGTDIPGQVYRFEDSDDNDAAYKMKFNSTRLMFDTALTIAKLRRLSVQGIAGLGFARNSVDLALEPYPDTHLEPLNFNGGSSTGFAYEFGAGLTYALYKE
ncbi:MAG: hypothetical protein ACHP9Y_04600, partial [Gammaproteobacteria bacterium]